MTSQQTLALTLLPNSIALQVAHRTFANLITCQEAKDGVYQGFHRRPSITDFTTKLEDSRNAFFPFDDPVTNSFSIKTSFYTKTLQLDRLIMPVISFSTGMLSVLSCL